MTEMSNTTKGQIAIQNIAWATVEIRDLEQQDSPDAAKLASLYALRLKEITAAMRAGVPAAELAAITGNGEREV